MFQRIPLFGSKYGRINYLFKLVHLLAFTIPCSSFTGCLGIAYINVKPEKCMCTVTYLPLKEGFIITSNRDERLVRKPADAPQIISGLNTRILFPRDGEAGGTWIATSENNRTVCLLNGAFVPHL